ncbi:MAG: hypothetical protein DME22_01725 [Verrucomicrobia bacterium]|nr:MAG: hypothetical protein DME22_01725 [Verrucomicrobiota bacterium]PYJ98792.1 MAG: hypothetical protein DME23_11105 [Verrucomicrobiota bacterium]
MNTILARTRKTEEGSSLFLVMTLIVIAFLMLASALSWSQNNALTIARNNQYWRTIAAAEAATEKVFARLHEDFQSTGENTIYNNSQGTAYCTTVPTAADSSYWSSYVFSDGQGRNNQTYVALVPGTRTNWTVLNSQYAGLSAIADTYQIVSYARDSQGRFNVSAGVQQNIQPSSIPAFQSAIFYNVDLEIEPGPNMIVTGRVHSNANIYEMPDANLTFQSDVTASGLILIQHAPGDPQTDPGGGTILYQAEHDSKAPTLTLPIAGGNDPTTAYEIIKPPPVGGDTDPALANERYYNKADVLITVTDTNVTAKSGSLNLGATLLSLPAGTVTSYTNKFYNGRELKGVNVVDIDVSKFKTWADDSSVVTGAGNLWALYGRQPSSIYVLDQRKVPANTEKGVRLINGSQLPNAGLTVATQDPLYVKGDFNIKDSTGTSSGSDTTHTKPASLVADAVTVLSTGWTDAANATSALGNLHAATSTTVNAAFLAGIVKTTPSSYSGGVENFPRFLENWSGYSLTYNGSMVVMFYSQIATGLWKGTGTYYNPPVRNWTFDNNFMNPLKLPPGTPSFRFVLRGDWLTVGRNPAG